MSMTDEYKKGFDDGINEVVIKLRHNVIGGLKASEREAMKGIDTLFFDFQKEVAEFTEAVADFKRKGTRTNRLHMLSEGVDCQLVMETLISAFEPYRDAREALRKDIVKGNEQAGYYAAPESTKIYRVFAKVGDARALMTEADDLAQARDAVNRFVKADKQNDDNKDYYIEEYLMNDCVCAYCADTGF
ncbi:hypothetical protein SELR_18400 [Selenomonas ruminantium subsp. lactilytica TAM6421]|uniref:Uncharacterized protein n=1 Tax=Selenomonas ruminantium subsp. lactilytica (strain NBRC 103574 / TAM6421) TaxID=927704 RepID=I0GS11_SELRL|nr:hypothetical protein [Selenomonas ruminantium]BAL83548.1 hypothetical protein SELR_18400 [Selenomonas ruminantium subsp. lactilytica TAM6421]